MRHFILTLILCFSTLFVKSQDHIQDSLEFESLILKNYLSVEKVGYLIELNYGMGYTNLDYFISNSKILRDIIEREKYYSLYTKYFDALYRIQMELNVDFDVDAILEDVLHNKERKLSIEDVNRLKYYKANMYFNSIKRAEESIKILQEILEDKENLPEPFLAMVYNLLGANYNLLGNYKEALEHAVTSDEILNNSGEDNVQLSVNNAILLSNIYHFLEDYKEEERFAKIASSRVDELENIRERISIKTNLASTYHSLQLLDSSMSIYKDNIRLSELYGYKNNLAQNQMNLGNLYKTMERYPEAIVEYNKALEVCYEENIDYGKLLIYFNMADAYLVMGEYTKAEKNYDSAKVYSEKFQNKHFKAIVYKGLSRVYEHTGRYKKALETYISFHETNSEVFDEEKQQAINDLQIKYDVELKNRELERAKSEIEINRTRTQLFYWLGISTLVVSIMVIIFLIYRNKVLRELYLSNIDGLKIFKNQMFQSSGTSENNPHHKLFVKLNDLMENEKIYKDPQLSINDLTVQLGSNQKYVSAAISDYANTNFNNYINSFRVREAKQLIIDDHDISLGEVMEECGYSSRTTFYNAFKRQTGLSPYQFKSLSKSMALRMESELQVEV